MSADVLVPKPRGAVWLSADGEVEVVTAAEALRRWRHAPPLLCHRPAVAARLGLKGETPPAFDVLELFAFAHPGRFAVPTARGLAEALGLPAPVDHADEALTLLRVVNLLLADARRADGAAIAWVMARHGWPWGPAILAGQDDANRPRGAGLRAWERLAEWSEHAPEPPAGDQPVEPAEARARLAAMLGPGAEERPSQADFASAGALAFAPRQQPGAPWMVLAEAGTGTGKTLGYVASASLWAEKNQAPVWISTYTRNLQRQLDSELDRLYPDRALKERRVVVRKGRENYLCLLNFEEAVQRLAPQGGVAHDREAVALGLMARWILASRDGDMVGGDLPGWLPDLLGRSRTLGLADRRGECVYSVCPHFRRCFIEKTIRRARRAHIVIANHALVMVLAAFGGLDDSHVPSRTVFDEGHHLFTAADEAFSAMLSGQETAELRRWLLGADGDGRKSRARGLRRRTEDLLAERPPALAALDDALAAARLLPAAGWPQRLAEDRPLGPAEAFLALLRRQVYARSQGGNGPYSLECEPRPPGPGLAEASAALADLLGQLEKPLALLAKDLHALLSEQAAELDSGSRGRIEAVLRGLQRRALVPLAAWRGMLDDLATAASDPAFVDWFAVERQDGRDIDVGYRRHWIDPMLPFARTVAAPAHGLLITSATLRDGSGDLEADWRAAEQRSGAAHLPLPAVRAAVASPFDYPAQTRVMVVTDVRKDDLDQVAAAYRELFIAAGGGALGLFTAVVRLREVWRRIAEPLDEAGLPLLAQHVDGMDIGTTIDIFRAEEDACLLGTDAVRDGVDVPGRSLRLIVFDRVPWPRPDILHKARRSAFGARSYDDMITRLRLKQAFGRLIRRAGDAGVFVLLDPMMPSRLAGAFPPGVAIERLGLAEAVRETRAFLSPGTD
ncbi:MAG TPA: ATP-dependent DNA helicase [Rhodospirillaceae bacterium]|nr:ATP-dependent DNA helicase [Rhodospirillaceae bacterium]